MPRVVPAAVVLVALAVVAWLCATRWDEVAAALGAVPPGALGAAVALHLVVLVVRSEAWRVALAAVAAPALPRLTVHSVNAGAFLMGAVQSQVALPTRVALLRRAPSAAALRPGQIGVADAPIFLLEILGAGVMLAVGLAAGAGTWWAAAAVLLLGAGALLGARRVLARCAHRPLARGLAVLGDARRRRVLVGLVGAITAVTVARIWLVLGVCGLPHGPAALGTVFAALGVSGLLPVGPAGSPAATLATLGASGVGSAVAAGLLISASSVVAVLVYALVALLAVRLAERPRATPPPDPGGRFTRTSPSRGHLVTGTGDPMAHSDSRSETPTRERR